MPKTVDARGARRDSQERPSLHVWVMQTGEPIPVVDDAQRPMRAGNLCRALVAAGHRVTLWTADFNHAQHVHRYGRDTRLRRGSLEIRFIHSAGYNSNVSIGRLSDHAQLALRLRRLLRSAIPPDVALVGFPPIEAAAAMVTWLGAHNVPTLIDYKDQWPEVLLRSIPERARTVGRIALSGHYHWARRALIGATGISSISDPFLDLALTQARRPRGPWDEIFPLTASPPYLSAGELASASAWWDGMDVRNDGRYRVIFVGSFNSAFDMAPVARAALSNPAIQFVICGTGSHEHSFRALLEHIPNVIMPGWINQAQSHELHKRATVALGPYKPTQDFALSVPNKIYDALMYGVPIATSLTGATLETVVKKGAGIAYSSSDDSLSDELRSAVADGARRSRMTVVAQDLYRDSYSFERVYGGMTKHLESMVLGHRRKDAINDG